MSGQNLLLLSAVQQAISDPYFEYTTLLLPGNGTNGAQNNTFLDSSTNAFSITRNGNTTQGTFSPFSQTGWGNYFDGTGDYLSVASNSAFQYGTGDFTIEFWWYPSTLSALQPLIYHTDDSGVVGTGEFVITFNTSLGLRFYVNSGAINISQGSTSGWSTNTWYHVAAVRNGNTVTLYRNGTSIASGSVTGATIGANVPTYIFGEPFDPFYSTGYMSNLRIVKGTAVYTADFTPPTAPLTAITNTSLLTCQSNRFIDNSTNAFAITRNGDVSVQAFSPFNPTAAWSASTNGGSGYFDGSGDYLNTASNAAFALGSGSFTIEMWVYSGANGTSTRLGGNGAGGSFTTNRWIIATSTAANPNKFTLAAFNTSPVDLLVSTSTFNNSQWMHVAIARSGNAWAMWVNGAREAYVASNSAALDGGSSEVFNLGRSNLSGDADWAGYVSGFKMVKGTAVYDPASTTITVPTAPPTNTTNTSLLLNTTNAGIYDATSKNDLETVGNAQISTTQSKFGGSSMYFDGTGDWLRAPASPNLDMGTGDLTIEGWFYLTATVAVDYRMIVSDATNGNNYVAIRSGGTGGQLEVNVNGTSFRLNLNNTVTINTWFHLAVVRYGGTWNGFVNGASLGTSAAASAFNLGNGGTFVGRFGGATAYEWPGYIDDLRITKGIARYTSNFTPPSTAFLTL